jgi:hypothetical protein
MTNEISYFGGRIKEEFKLYDYLENQKQYNLPAPDDDRMNKLKVEFVPFHQLKITQKQKDSFSPEHVIDIVENFHPALLRPSGVAKYNGDYILWDGHHSATVSLCMGMQGAICMVYECDTIDEINDILTYDTIESFDKNQLLDMIDCSDDLREEILKRFNQGT